VQLFSLARRQIETGWPGAVAEIVHIAPVVGDGLPLGPGLEELHDGGGASGTGFAEDEDIKFGILDAEAEFDGGQRPVLPDRPLQRGELFSGFEFELGRVAAPGQFLGREAELIHVVLYLFLLTSSQVMRVTGASR
jgi:hypothetical protein